MEEAEPVWVYTRFFASMLWLLALLANKESWFFFSLSLSPALETFFLLLNWLTQYLSLDLEV